MSNLSRFVSFEYITFHSLLPSGNLFQIWVFRCGYIVPAFILLCLRVLEGASDEFGEQYMNMLEKFQFDGTSTKVIFGFEARENYDAEDTPVKPVLFIVQR